MDSEAAQWGARGVWLKSGGSIIPGAGFKSRSMFEISTSQDLSVIIFEQYRTDHHWSDFEYKVKLSCLAVWDKSFKTKQNPKAKPWISKVLDIYDSQQANSLIYTECCIWFDSLSSYRVILKSLAYTKHDMRSLQRWLARPNIWREISWLIIK